MPELTTSKIGEKDGEGEEMVSKRILLVAVCVAVLTTTVGVFAYNSLNNPSNTKTFVFEWSPEEQTIIDGTLRMELTFTKNEKNLSVLVIVNDYNANYSSQLVMVFDMDQSGEIEEGEPCYVFFGNNWTRSPAIIENAWWNGRGAYEWGCSPQPSPYHTFVFDESGGTFDISIPIEELDLVNDLVIVSYVMVGTGAAWKQFNFDLEV